MAFQENLNASICMFSFFRSHGSNVSHVSGCRARFFHGYAWYSLRLCSCGLTTRMESLKMFPHHHHHLVFFSARSTYALIRRTYESEFPYEYRYVTDIPRERSRNVTRTWYIRLSSKIRLRPRRIDSFIDT